MHAMCIILDNNVDSVMQEGMTFTVGMCHVVTLLKLICTVVTSIKFDAPTKHTGLPLWNRDDLVPPYPQTYLDNQLQSC